MRLRDITSKIGSGATPKGGESVYLPSRVNCALVRSQNVYDRWFDSTSLAFISDEHAKELAGVELRTGDLLLNITGDGVTFSRCCMVPDEILPARVNQHVSIIRIRPDLCLPGYLLSYLTHPTIKEYVESFNSGGSRRAITKGHIESFLVPLPPLLEQAWIGKILEALDRKIGLGRKMNQTLETMARAIFKSWFVDFDPVREGHSLFSGGFGSSPLGPIPAGWSTGTLSDLVEVVLGGDWGSDSVDSVTSEAALCIRGADIPGLQSGGGGKMPVRYLKPASLVKRALRHGDLVVEVSGGSPSQSTGRPVLVSRRLLERFPCSLVCSNFCRMIRPKYENSAKFLYYWLLWLYANDEFLQYENGTTGIKNLAFTAFAENFRMVIPPSEVYKEFDRMISPLLDRQQCNGAESETLAALRDTLLPKLLSGEVRVKQAEKIVGEAV